MSNPIQIKLPSKKPFPLWALLTIYESAAYKDVFVDYMEGMQLLINWLSPIEIPEYSIINIPKLHRNYELNHIATMLNVHPSIVYKEYKRVIWQTM